MPEPERSLRIARWHLENDKCHQCGNPRSMCSDPEQPWYPQRIYCYATAAQQSAARQYDTLHEDMPFHDGTFTNWGEKCSPFTPFKHDDGVTIIVTAEDFTPDDDFLEPPKRPTATQEA